MHFSSKFSEVHDFGVQAQEVSHSVLGIVWILLRRFVSWDG